jgi:hypothetical protein
MAGIVDESTGSVITASSAPPVLSDLVAAEFDILNSRIAELEAVLRRIQTADCDATGGAPTDPACDCVPCSAHRVLGGAKGSRE